MCITAIISKGFSPLRTDAQVKANGLAFFPREPFFLYPQFVVILQATNMAQNQTTKCPPFESGLGKAFSQSVCIRLSLTIRVVQAEAKREPVLNRQSLGTRMSRLSINTRLRRDAQK